MRGLILGQLFCLCHKLLLFSWHLLCYSRITFPVSFTFIPFTSQLYIYSIYRSALNLFHLPVWFTLFHFPVEFTFIPFTSQVYIYSNFRSLYILLLILRLF
ncbi:unnamed protein product [Prunus brigantina]